MHFHINPCFFLFAAFTGLAHPTQQLKALRCIALLQSQKRFREHVVHGLSWPLVSAPCHAGNLQCALKKNTRRQHGNVMKNGQLLLSGRPIYTAHGKCDARELVLAAPERKASRHAFCWSGASRSHSIESSVNAPANNAIGGRVNEQGVTLQLEGFC